MTTKKYDHVDAGEDADAAEPGCLTRCCNCLVTCPGKFGHFLMHKSGDLGDDDRRMLFCLLTPGHWCQIITFLVTLWIISGLFWYLMFYLVVQYPTEALYAFLIACALFTALFGVLMALEKDEEEKLSMGCTVAELKQHINKQMAADMSWDTFGENWHIVHKMEIYEDNPSDTADHRITALCARLHYTNTEPVWGKDMHRGSMIQTTRLSHVPPPSISTPASSAPAQHEETKGEKVVTLHQ